MGKNPAFLFYPNDYLRDTQAATPSVRGIWMDLLCAMWWSQTRGVLTGTEEEMCRYGRCSLTEWRQFVELNSRQSLSDLTVSNNILTVSNRRMVREERARELGRSRSQRHYHRHSNADLTPPSPVPSTPSTPVPASNTSTQSPSETSEQPKELTAPTPTNGLPDWFLTVLKESPNFCPLLLPKHAGFWHGMTEAYDPYEWLAWDEQIHKADLWIAANPKRKPRQLTRFLRNWFEKAVEIGRIQHAKEERARTFGGQRRPGA